MPKINIINEPRKIFFTKQSKDIIQTQITSQEYYEYTEDKWRNKVAKLTTSKFKIQANEF